MPTPEDGASRGRGRNLFTWRQPGTATGEAGAQDFKASQTEHNFRQRPTAVAAAPIPQQVASVAQPSIAQPQQPRTTTTQGPDREHKESGNIYGAYVDLMPDHGAEDQDTPTNAGYRTDGVAASSLNDAYSKALKLAAGFHGKEGSRVCIRVKGGQWLEDLNCTSDSIDLQGSGRPRIYGHVTIAPSATQFRMSNFECRSPDNQEAVRVAFAPFMPLGVSPIKFFDVWFHGNRRGFWSERKVFLYGCEGWSDIDNTSVEDAVMTFSSAIDDNDFSLAVDCRFRAYAGLNSSITGILPPGVRTPSGFAIKATGKTGFGYLPPYYDSNLGYLRPMSGLELSYCTVEGSLLCEGWVVLHKHCQVYAGMLSLTVNGGFYAKIRGYWFGPKLLNGIIQFDNSTVHAGHIAEFYADASQTNPNVCGGLVHFRHSTHLKGLGGAAAATCANFGGTALFYHDKMSTTASTNWLGGGGTSTPDDTTGCALPVDVMFDPHLL